MTTKIGRYLGVSAATVALALFACAAQAQEKKPEPPKPKKPAACKTLKKQPDCEGRTDCHWTAATMKGEKQVKAAYCAANPTKKAEPKKTEPKKVEPKKGDKT